MSGVREWRRRRRADAICVMAIAILATLFMHRWLRPGYTPLPLNLESAILPWHGQVNAPPQNLLVSDPFYNYYPSRQYLTDSLRQGMLPLWNPHILSGHPVLGDTSMPGFYPPNLLAALAISPARALPLLAWLHVILAGWLMYVFLRVRRLGPAAALLGSIPWMLSEFMVVWLEYPEFPSTLAWIPAMFACFELAAQRRAPAWAALGGLLFGLEILGGQTQVALHSAMLLGLYAVLHSARNSWQQRRLDLWPLLALALIGGIGVGVGAVQLFPTYQMAKLSHRQEWLLHDLIATRWPLTFAVRLWLPDFWGNAIRYDYRGVINFAETATYFGLAPVFLGLASLPANRSRHYWFAVCLFVFILLVAGGTWLAQAMIWVPGFSYFNLSRLAGLLAFPGAIMAASSVEALQQCQTSRRLIGTGMGWAMMAALTIVVIALDPNDSARHWSIIRADIMRSLLLGGLATLAVVALARWPRPALVGLIALTFADLYQWGEPFNPIYPISLLYPDNEVVRVLKQDQSVYRTLPLRGHFFVFGPNVLSVFGISEAGGYSSLTVQQYQELFEAIDPHAQLGSMITARRFQPLYSLLNVKYVLSPRELPTIATLANYEGCSRQTAPLAGDGYFEQSFEAAGPGLNRVDVSLARVGQPGNQPVRFRLWRGQVGHELIADIATSSGDLPDRERSVFFFAPVADSSGDRFAWRLEAPGARPDATVAVCLADNVEHTASFAAFGVLLQHVDFQQGVWMYQNPNALPRAYIVHHVQVAPGASGLEALRSPQFNMYRTVILDAPLPAKQAISLSPSPVRSGAQANIVRYKAHRVDIQAQTPAPGVLVLSDVYYPGWQVRVNGRAAQLLRVNHALRGVYLPAGTHSVSFRFEPLIFILD